CVLSATPCAKRTTTFPQGGGSSPLFLATVRRAQKYPPQISIWSACPERLHFDLHPARARTSGYHRRRSRLRVRLTLSLADLQPSGFRVSRVSHLSLCLHRADAQQAAEGETHLCCRVAQQTARQVCASQRRVLPRTC